MGSTHDVPFTNDSPRRLKSPVPEGWIPQVEIELDGATAETANALADTITDLMNAQGFENVQVEIDLVRLVDPGAPSYNVLADKPRSQDAIARAHKAWAERYPHLAAQAGYTEDPEQCEK